MKTIFSIILNFILFGSLIYLISEYENLYKKWEDLNKLPKEDEFCSDYENVLHFRHIKFNEYEATSDVKINEDGTCHWMNIYKDFKNPHNWDFKINSSDEIDLCNKIKLKCEKLK